MPFNLQTFQSISQNSKFVVWSAMAPEQDEKSSSHYIFQKSFLSLRGKIISYKLHQHLFWHWLKYQDLFGYAKWDFMPSLVTK